MGILTKAAVIGGGYYIYKEHKKHQAERRAQEHLQNQQASANMSGGLGYPAGNNASYHGQSRDAFGAPAYSEEPSQQRDLDVVPPSRDYGDVKKSWSEWQQQK